MGESSQQAQHEVAAIRAAIEMGYRVIDTAEMYGEGGAEAIVGNAVDQAIRAGDVARDDLFIVSKVYPHNATAAAMVQACERSRSRLRMDRIDAYLLHWRGAVPLDETVAAFERLQEHGRIRYWGVSNFDVSDMKEIAGIAGGARCVTNQIYFSLSSRGPAFDLLPWQQSRGFVTMAYSPIDQGALLQHDALRQIAARRNASPASLAIAWLVAQEGVMAIPKATSALHLRDNMEALSLTLSAHETAELDRAFPPPRRKAPLSMR